ncbi:hypothetical protein DIE21_32010, partial [Burkholderia sp. Bp9140]
MRGDIVGMMMKVMRFTRGGAASIAAPSYRQTDAMREVRAVEPDDDRPFLARLSVIDWLFALALVVGAG